MVQEDERRSYFRVHDHLAFDFRKITPEEFQELKDTVGGSLLRSPEEDEEDRFFSRKGVKPEEKELYTYMRMVNQKLDTVINMLSGRHEENFQNACTEISLCGAGIQFVSNIQFSAGDYAELKLTVPIFPYPRIAMLCQVVRTEDVEGGSTGPFKVAMKFLVISERDRDFLVKYVFEKEREYLRRERDNEG